MHRQNFLHKKGQKNTCPWFNSCGYARTTGFI